MHRIFINSQNIFGNKITISDKDIIHHVKDVLRLKINEEVAACDKAQNVYQSVVEALSPQKLTLRISKIIKTNLLNKMRLTIACAIPKNAKFDEIVDKLTQLGVDEIIPLETARVIVKLDQKKINQRLERWQKIALSASQQSQRSAIAKVGEVRKIDEFLKNSNDFDLKLIPTLEGNRISLATALANKAFKNILVIIGPEGDFSQQEIGLAKNQGFIPVTLGELVFRVDTACIAAASYIKLGAC